MKASAKNRGRRMLGTVTALLAALLLPAVSFGISHAAPLTLADALARRATASRTLKIAALDEQVVEDTVQATRSGFLPRLDLQGGYTVQHAPQAVSTPFATFETQEPEYASLSLHAYQTLYDFGRTGARHARAQAGRDAARLGYRYQKQDLFLRTVTSYFRILREQKLLHAAEEEVKQMTDHLRVARSLFEEGVVTRNDLLQAEVRLAGSRQRRLELANRLDNSWLDLNNQIGESPEARFDLFEETVVDLADPDRPADEALANRAEILAQRKLVDAAESEVTETRSGYFPEIFLKAGMDYVQNDRVREQAIYSASLGFKVNLFDGFATTARHRQAVKNRSRNEEQLRRLEADLALEYRVAVNDARVALERIAVTEASIRQGEENLRINKDRYTEQVGTATEVIDAQTLLTEIRTEHYQALFDYQVARARVKRARGEL